MLFLKICVARMLIEYTHITLNIEILLGVRRELLIVERLVLGQWRWRGRLSGGLGRLGGSALPLLLIPNLVVDVGIEPGNFFIINQNGDFALPIAQLVSLLPHLLPGSQGHRQSFILHQHVSPLRGQLVAFDLHIAYESEATEDGVQILLVGELWVVAN